MSDQVQITWKELAKAYPEEIQWLVQRFGPLPDGPIKREDYERYWNALEANKREHGNDR